MDTNDFLRKLPKQFTGSKTLIAIDIVQLYPSINNQLGIKALDYWFGKLPEKFIKSFNKDFGIELIKFIQDNVYFTFNNKTYKQVQGTAMGKSQAPPYANMTIAYLILEYLFPAIERDYGMDIMNHVKDNLKLFLDDGFTLLDENLLSSSKLLEYLNNMDESIKFTMDASNEHIPFLDVLVKIKTDRLDSRIFHIATDIYHKETDTFDYFPFHSCGPNHIARNIPYNLARRIAMIVSDKHVRDIRLNELKPRLLAKKYPINLIEDSIRKAKTDDREILLNQTKTPKTQKAVNLPTLSNFLI